MEERNAVVRALTHTYKLITRFGRERSDAARVSQHDMTILGRKLFAAFEHKAGKIDIVNRGLENDLSELRLTVVRAQARGGQDSRSLYRGAPSAETSGSPLKRTNSLVELLTWCYFNGVLSRTTRMTVQQADVEVSARDIETLHGHLRTHFSAVCARGPDVSELEKPPELLAVSTFVNLGIDPMASYTRQGKRLTSSHIDALSYGGLHENLIREIDYLLITTWREVLTLRYQGIQGLLECLAEHLSWVSRAREAEVPLVPCNCFTPGYAQAITRRVAHLFDDVTSWYRSDPGAESKLYVVKGEDQYYALRSLNGQVSSDYIGPMPELMRYLGQPRDSYTAVTMDPFALSNSPLELVYTNWQRGKVSCHYYVTENIAHLFVVDEHGALFNDRVMFHSDATLVRHLGTFFESVQYRQNSGSADDPQSNFASVDVEFYRITKANDHTYRRRMVDAAAPGPNSMGFNVKVIGERVEGATQFTLYCDDREFSTLDHGDNVFEALAEHILRKRGGGERYPIFITDIDLSGLETDTGSGKRLQTIHYLRYKKRIEDRLNEIVLSDE